MRKIDAHLHLHFNQFNADGIIRYMNDNDIEKCWLLSWEELNPPVPSLYQHLSVDEIMEAYLQYPDRFIPFYAPDPLSETVREDLQKHLDAGLRGCGELKVNCKWEDKTVDDYLKIISEFRLPLVFHMEAPGMHYFPDRSNLFDRALGYLMNGAFNGTARYYVNLLSQKTSLFSGPINRKNRYIPGYLFDFDFLEKRLIQYPHINFIGHGPHFWNNISSELSDRYFYQKGPIKDFGIIDLLLEKYDNFYCDVSGRSGYYALKRDPEQSREFLNKHAGKVLYGTDNLTGGKLEKLILSLNLADEKMKHIFYKNAERLIAGSA